MSSISTKPKWVLWYLLSRIQFVLHLKHKWRIVLRKHYIISSHLLRSLHRLLFFLQAGKKKRERENEKDITIGYEVLYGLVSAMCPLQSGFSMFLVPWKIHALWTSLVTQWLRIHLPMQGTRVRALVQEDPTCLGAAKSVSHNHWACALEPTSHNYWAHVPRARALQQEKLLQWEAHSPQLEKVRAQQWRPNTAKNK